MAGFWALIILGGVLGALLAYVSIRFAVPENPLLQKLTDALPGYNCGACGQSGCAGYAELLAGKKASPDLCRPGGAETLRKLAEILHQEIATAEKKTAFVFCNGGVRAIDAYAYSGIENCSAAVLVQGGYKQCRWGCLGFGDCAAACEFGAITLGEENLPVINADKCVDCGACIKACPKGLIQSTLQREVKRVSCSNHDAGNTARSVCTAACLACGLCVKACAFQAIVLKEKLAVIDTEKCTNCGVCAEKCPTKAII